MSVSLLDVNVLVALIDPAHVHFDAAHRWFSSLKNDKWATCPITVNGCVRVLSRPGYAGRPLSVAEACELLLSVCRRPNHEFWPDDLSLFNGSQFHLSKLNGPGQVTDVYLLALAVARNGHLATFDRTIPWHAVRGAAQSHLRILGGG